MYNMVLSMRLNNLSMTIRSEHATGSPWFNYLRFYKNT